tara:strand:+ start:114 stop:296 length:183 start_codon:yes stop_codon:yes gene_type:complete
MKQKTIPKFTRLQRLIFLSLSNGGKRRDFESEKKIGKFALETLCFLGVIAGLIFFWIATP